VSDGTLAFVGLGGADLDAYAGAFPQGVVKAGYGRLGVCVVHVNEGELFEDVAFDYFAKLLEELFELGVACCDRYIADVDLDRLAHFYLFRNKCVVVLFVCEVSSQNLKYKSINNLGTN